MLHTPVTALLGLKHPILLAGMASVSNAELAAAVSNAGGLGVVGGAFISASKLRSTLQDLKTKLRDPLLPFGVDLLIPAVGGSARKTNHDYTHGELGNLVDVIIEEGVKLFVCAVGVPPKWAVDKLHAAGILCMNMVGSPKHVPKALAVGVDMICAQGTEAGGHTGDIATMVLVPQVVDLCKTQKSPLHGGPIEVIAAGGIYDGRGLAAALALGASAVWVGTRFVAATEAGCGDRHKDLITQSTSDETIRTLIYSGRPMRIHRTAYAMQWEKRQAERDAILESGNRVYKTDLAVQEAKGTPLSFAQTYPVIFGQACGGIEEVKPAKAIIEDMVMDAREYIVGAAARFVVVGAAAGASRL